LEEIPASDYTGSNGPKRKIRTSLIGYNFTPLIWRDALLF